MSECSKHYDLEERTAKFGIAIIKFSQRVTISSLSKPLIIQLIRAATGIGANYMEANGASSKKDFKNKIYIAKKETQETKHWLRMIAEYYPQEKIELRRLWQEAQELTLIFSKIVRTAATNQ
ncbi:four helix bundle protein [Candidatus Falkowbacteria bacterium]|nr:four helix bundle protein [Candidatus Falkowbacteria bacterium]